MAEKRPPAPTPKLKKKFPVTGQTTKKGNNLNPKVVIKPIDQNQGQNALSPPNQQSICLINHRTYQIHPLHHLSHNI